MQINFLIPQTSRREATALIKRPFLDWFSYTEQSLSDDGYKNNKSFLEFQETHCSFFTTFSTKQYNHLWHFLRQRSVKSEEASTDGCIAFIFPTKPQDKLLHIRPVCTLPYRSFDSQVHSWRHTSRLQRISLGLVGLTILWGLWPPWFIVKGSLTRICILALQKPTRTKAKVRTKNFKRLLQLCFSRKVHSFASDQRRTLLWTTWKQTLWSRHHFFMMFSTMRNMHTLWRGSRKIELPLLWGALQGWKYFCEICTDVSFLLPRLQQKKFLFLLQSWHKSFM